MMECIHCNAQYEINMDRDEDREPKYCPVCGEEFDTPSIDDDQLEFNFRYMEDGDIDGC